MAAAFDRLEIGNMTLRNRFVRAATAESLCTASGAPTRRLRDLYCELADGGVGAIITGFAYASPDGKPAERALSLCYDFDEGSVRALVNAVHACGSRLIAQLVYGGSKSVLSQDDPRRCALARCASDVPEDSVAVSAGAFSGSSHEVSDAGVGSVPTADVIGPSAVAHPRTGLVPRAASETDLLRVRRSFAEAAARAKAVRFDGVEIHAAHGYLLSQFLDGRFNRRDDAYGGAIENRMRFVVECVEEVRRAVGDAYPVLVKLNSCDSRSDPAGESGGLSEADSMSVAFGLARAGASCIEVSGDWHAFSAADAAREPFFADYGARLAAQLDIPVIVTGGWRDFATVERMLDESGIAAVGLCRPLICESDLVARWRDGNTAPSRCTSCNYCARHQGVPCIVTHHRP